jgi:hypothetical protein
MLIIVKYLETMLLPNSKFVELDVYQTKSWTPDYLTLAYKSVYSLLFGIVCMSVYKVKFDAPTQPFGDWPDLVLLLLALKQSRRHRSMFIKRKEGVL